LKAVLACRPVPAVVDADALILLEPPLPERPSVFTPHLGEFRAQFGDQLADQAANDRWAAAVKAAQKAKATVLLKGVPTVIADLRGPVHVVASGNPGLATGGSGDLLAGFIGAFLARGSAGPAAAAALPPGTSGTTARSSRWADGRSRLPSTSPSKACTSGPTGCRFGKSAGAPPRRRCRISRRKARRRSAS